MEVGNLGVVRDDEVGAEVRIETGPAWVPSRLPAEPDYRWTLAVALNEPGSTKQLDLIRGKLAARGLRTQVGGATGVLADVNMQVSADAARAEVLAMPVLFILMLVVFRGLIAALTPLLVGGLAILGALTFTRMLTWVTEVSVFALNMITLLGLGMAIDYSLFVVSRFREELAAGHPVPGHRERTCKPSTD